MKIRSFVSLSLALVFGAAITPHAEAANDAWSTNPTTGNFADANWTINSMTGGAATGTIASGDNLYFDTSTITTLNENETAGFSIGSFIFNSDASAYTISGKSFALGTAGITNNSANLQTINDAFTFSSTTLTTAAGGGNLALGGAITGSGALTVAGGGTVTLSGGGSSTGNINVGTSNGSNSTLNLSLATGTSLEDNGNSIYVGTGSSTSNGVINQSGGGTVNPLYNTGSQLFVGANGGYGSYTISAGTLNTGTLRTGGYNGATAANSYFMQTGGTVNVYGNALIGRVGGNNVLYVNGGTFNANTSVNTGDNLNLDYNNSGTAVLTLAAGAINAGTTPVVVGGTGGTTNAITVNLNGGTLNTAGFILNQTPNSTSIVNFGGGTLQANGSSTTFMSGLTNAYLYAPSSGTQSSATIDTNGSNITISQSLKGAGGQTGVTIGLGTGGSGYIGAPVVVISGTGTGATGIANISGGSVTSITITSPGTGYSGTPTISLVGGGGTGATGTISTTTNASDTGLTKIGGGNLTLTGLSTYTGGTIVNNGTLALDAGGAAGAVRGVLTVNAGASLSLAINNALGYTAGTQVTTLNINGGSVNTTGALGDEGYLTSFNLTGGTLAYTGTNASNAYQFAAADATAPGITSNASATQSLISGDIDVRTGNLLITVAKGTTAGGVDLQISGLIESGGTAANTYGITKAGPGVLMLSGANTYTGPTTVNSGTLQAGVASVTGSNPSGPFGNNSAVIMANTAGATLSLTNGGTGTANNFNTQIGSLTGGGTAGGGVTLGSATLTVGGDNTSPAAYAGVISGTGALTKIGTGTLTLSGANTYNGATTVSGGTLSTTAAKATPGSTGGTLVNTSGVVVNGTGTLLLSANNSVNSAATVSLGSTSGTTGLSVANGVLQGMGATVAGGMVTGGTPTTAGFGALTLTGNATLAFAGSSGTVVFSSFTDSGSYKLNVTGSNFASVNAGNSSDGTTDRLIIQGDQSVNLADFTFNGVADAGEIPLDGNFYEISPVPEPATWAAGLLSVGSLGFSQRRRLRGWMLPSKQRNCRS